MEVWDGKSIDIFGVRRPIYSGTLIEKVRIFIMGILAQQSISENQRNPPK